MKKRGSAKKTVASSAYDAAYYLGDCEGWEEYSRQELSIRLQMALSLQEIRQGHRVLDIGCGRGEVALWAAERGAHAWGIDYAPEAVRIAWQRLQASGDKDRVGFLVGNARELPFAAGSFDLVFMLDIVEHLYPQELTEALSEARRVLRPTGRLVVHTAPNLWYYRWAYPIYRLTERLTGAVLPADPRRRFRYHSVVHVNEQSPASLAKVLGQAGFRARIWVDGSRAPWGTMGGVSRWLGRLVTRAPLVRWVVCGDIYAVARAR